MSLCTKPLLQLCVRPALTASRSFFRPAAKRLIAGALHKRFEAHAEPPSLRMTKRPTDPRVRELVWPGRLCGPARSRFERKCKQAKQPCPFARGAASGDVAVRAHDECLRETGHRDDVDGEAREACGLHGGLGLVTFGDHQLKRGVKDPGHAVLIRSQSWSLVETLQSDGESSQRKLSGVTILGNR